MGVAKRRSVILLAVVVSALWLVLAGNANGQGLPPGLPSVFGGTVASGGIPVRDGLRVFARIGTSYESQPVTIEGGRYDSLIVAPPEDTNLVGQTVRFFLEGTVEAAQTSTYQPGVVNSNFNLTFPSVPAPTPTPAPTATNTPIPTATPRVALPAVYSGEIVIAGADIPLGAELIARIGAYESVPARIEGDTFSGLVVDPADFNLVGQTIEFVLDGVVSRTTERYVSGAVKRDLVLVFVEFPTPTPTRTPTPVPSPTATSVPTATPTPQPSPTATAAAASSPTAVPATVSPDGGSGGCSTPSADAPITAGLANFLVMLAPVLLLGAYRRLRK